MARGLPAPCWLAIMAPTVEEDDQDADGDGGDPVAFAATATCPSSEPIGVLALAHAWPIGGAP